MDFLALAKKRYACRKYLDRKVEPEKLAAVLEAGRVAPTGANRQPQRLIVVESPEGMERLARCTRDFGAPAAVVVCADTSEVWTRKYDGKRIGDIDASDMLSLYQALESLNDSVSFIRFIYDTTDNYIYSSVEIPYLENADFGEMVERYAYITALVVDQHYSELAALKK